MSLAITDYRSPITRSPITDYRSLNYFVIIELVEAPPVQRQPDLFQQRQALVDADQLRLLGILAPVYGGFSLFMMLISSAGMVFMMQMLADPHYAGPNGPPAFFRGYMVAYIAFFLTLYAVTAGLAFFAGKCIRERRNWKWAVAAACVACINMPLGTALGVFMLVVLYRPSVRAVFDSSRPVF